MNNKLIEILDEFHSIYGHKIQEDLHEEYRETLAEKLVEYARSKIPEKEALNRLFGDSVADTFRIETNNILVDTINRRIDQDLQSLNN